MQKSSRQKKASSKRNKRSRRYKDSVFRLLFQEKKELLTLYNAVNQTDHTDPEELEAVPLSRNEMLLRVRNDVSCVVNFRMDLYEHQSTYNPNIPVRLLFYVSNAYYEWIDKKGLDLYSKTGIKIPTPKFFVFYNGTGERPDMERMRLSDLYFQKDEEPALELIVVQYNINAGHNSVLLEKCEALKGYSVFVEKVRTNHAKGMPVDEAVKSAVGECIRENILAEFFQEHYEEVIKMRTAEYWEERHERALYQEGIEAGRKEGHKAGRAEGFQALILTCRELGVSYETALEKIRLRFGLDEKKAQESMAKYWKED